MGDKTPSLDGSGSFLLAFSEARREALLSGGRRIDLEAGQRLFSRGDPGDACYLLLSGELEAVMSKADGRETWLATIGPGMPVGELAVLDGEPRSADLTATRRSKLVRIGREPFLRALTEEPAAAIALLATVAYRLRATDTLLEEASAVSLPCRLSRLLLAAPRTTLTQTALARRIGASRERINRTLSDWRKRGWVEVDRTGIHIRDADALSTLVDREW
jgi:CRP/FNR family transcriptional regulator, cyclic AMP receptor protein